MGMDGTIDARMQAALTRLTDNEKECLRRRLRQQTAKEMALDLGVSPHAVEKRLKMARAKLGLSSSLEAARLLAAVDQRQLTGPQRSDLEPEPHPRQMRFTRPLVVGGIAMAILAATLIALAQAPSSGGAAPADTGGVAGHPSAAVAPADVPRDELGRPTMANGRPVIYEAPPDPADIVTPTPAEIAAVIAYTFPITDQNHSGFIETYEAPVRGDADIERKIYDRDEQGNVVDTGRTVTVTAEQARAQYIAMGDKNGDGRIDFGEYRAWMAPMIAKNGIPARWREDIERNYRVSAD
jgi:DNA-binding CsgD family transcriptional regulator